MKNLQKRLEFEAELERSSPPNKQTRDKMQIFETEILEDAPPPPPNNLTQSLSPIIGREKEIAEIRNLLSQNNVRLLTMTGIGGTGKTTLAQAVAQEALTNFKDGVFFVELAAVTNPELVASTIAQTLSLKETGGKPVLEILEDYLSGRQTLLVLDNFEQVLTAAPVLAKLVQIAPDLKILVTSRARLHLSQDCEFAVPPLAVPENLAQISLNELSEYESVRLFVERARAVKPNFALRGENANSVVEICLRLDGLPLAIELAAARVRIIPPQSILERLENRLKLLTGGAKDLPARQQTVRGMVEWSYELLDEGEKILFRRLAVFAGGFTFEAAEAVCANYESNEDQKPETKNQIEILDGITSLLDSSLLVQKEQADGESRFRMLEVVREYALDRLEASKESEDMRRNHAGYFLALGEEAEPHLQSVESVKWLNRLEEELDNLRSMLEWSLKHNAEIAARLAGAIRHFWNMHNHLAEGRRWLKTAHESSTDSPPAVRFKLLNGLGFLAQLQGDYAAARKAHEECLAVVKTANIKQKLTPSLCSLASVAHQQGDLTTARKFYEEGLATAHELNNKYGIAGALNGLAEVAYAENDNAAARQFWEKAVTISRQIGNKQYVSACLVNLGKVAYHEGDYKTSRSHFTEAMAIGQELRSKILILDSLGGFVALAAQSGNLNRAARLAGATQHLCESIGYEADSVERRFRDAYLDKIKAALPETDFTDLFEQGRKLKLEEAVALCLEETVGEGKPAISKTG